MIYRDSWITIYCTRTMVGSLRQRLESLCSGITHLQLSIAWRTTIHLHEQSTGHSTSTVNMASSLSRDQMPSQKHLINLIPGRTTAAISRTFSPNTQNYVVSQR